MLCRVITRYIAPPSAPGHRRRLDPCSCSRLRHPRSPGLRAADASSCDGGSCRRRHVGVRRWQGRRCAVQQAHPARAVRRRVRRRGRHLQPRDSRRLEGRHRAHAGGRAGSQGRRRRRRRDGLLHSPHGVGVSTDGRIAVAEAGNNTLRLLTADAKAPGGYRVTTFAGVAGEKGNRDGPAAQALFNSPHAALWSDDGALYAPDIGNASIRRVANGDGRDRGRRRPKGRSSTRWTSRGRRTGACWWPTPEPTPCAPSQPMARSPR